MLKFDGKRIQIISLTSKHFKHKIPLLCVKPKNLTDKSVVFIFNGGIGNSIPSCAYMDNIAYDDNYFITYEKAGHNDNKNKPSQFKKMYLNELDEIVNWTKKYLPNKKIFLLGESWGTAINFVYYKKHSAKVDGAIGWNMPFRIVNPEKKTAKQMYSIVWRELLTFFFNVECHLPVVQSSQEKFSHDPLFGRLLQMVPPSKTNTKINLSVWRFMRPSYRFVCKNGKNPQYKFMYVQSGEDVLANWKVVKKITANCDSNHYYKIPTGYHVLSMEPKESKDLYNKVLEFIKE